MVEISLGGTSYAVARPTLYKWLSTERLRSSLIESAGKKDAKFVSELYLFLSALLNKPEEDFIQAPWFEILEAYYLLSVESSPKLDLSIIAPRKKPAEIGLPDPWEYEERVWYSWLHLLSKSYGWSIEYIKDLDVDDALALIQEISLEEQFQKEWEWSRFEYAYKFDKRGKGELRKLDRPEWMSKATKEFAKELNKPKPPMKTNLPASWTPPGVVIFDGQDDNTTDDERNSDTS